MGHVDHGKTSLLDHIRNTNVVAGEAGGITQHIGAYRVILKNGKSITFLDTPGHEAFTAMRARGAQVTDIVVIVVAADDSVMPQTIEAISHAKAANVPIIVAINKIDKPESNVDRIKQQLSERGILVEDWGGKFQCAEISAKKGINIDVLLDKILLEAEMLELKANPDRNAQGVVIESKMTKGWGNVASVVIQKGTLFLQDYFVAGANYGRIRALLDERGNKVEDVLPSQPVVVIGFDGLPDAGDTFMVCDTEAEAREIATRRKQLRREQALRKVHHTTLDDISAQISIGGVKDLNLVIKGDVAGSVEALGDSLLKLSTEEVRVNIVYKAAGIISESDVMLAAASSAVVIGFNISSTPQASRLAEEETVEIRHYNIIYDTINDIHLALEGMLKPDIKEEISALVEVRQIFKISKVGQIAGCYVTSGKISRNDKIRIIRNGFPIFSSLISSLKRNKDDAKEVDTNYECGIQVSNFNDFEVGDIIEAIKIVEIKRTLDK
jgi:translation initiation factor IF-2